ncbi:hypothetical protein SAMN05660691_00729 [Rheinheimera pacifica]|uniref:Uncharacterized protein n=1 Tax=Rheinheimera pacifica TaxID=173990 RepID=A0A1H6K3I7_9GAMM|nr:hypothetical protein SAMN05660691_00729 [Rheinheimera pacifica]
MPGRSDKVCFRSSGRDAAQTETAQGCAVEGGEESISLSQRLQWSGQLPQLTALGDAVNMSL